VDASITQIPEQPVLTWSEFLALGRGADEEKLQSELDARIGNTRPGHCATLIYTSGTTGNPKAVMCSHDNVTWTARGTLSYFPRYGKAVEERLISFLPLSHVAAQIVDIHVPMSIAAHSPGNCVVWFARPDALKGSLTVTLQAAHPTAFLGVPRVWEKMQEKMTSIAAKSGGLKKTIAAWAKSKGFEGFKAGEVGGAGLLPSMHVLAEKLVFNKVKLALGLDKCGLFFSAAAPISPDTINFFGSLGIELMELYGMSESSGPATVCRYNYRKVGSVGIPYSGVEVKLDHVDGRDPAGEGEICLRGRNVMMGYLKDPEKTREAIDEKGYLRSGDVGRLDQHGMAYITGRIKELIITAGGENVAPVPIEDTLKRECPAISNCMLVGDHRKFNSIVITLKTVYFCSCATAAAIPDAAGS